jgi:hypothetical protein
MFTIPPGRHVYDKKGRAGSAGEAPEWAPSLARHPIVHGEDMTGGKSMATVLNLSIIEKSHQ